jgi:hypothetical protein
MNLAHSKPIDRTASQVISRGEHFDFAQGDNVHDSPLPLPTRKATGAERKSRDYKDFTGQRCGRLTVIGRAADYLGRWVCRCDCGNYCIRKSRGLFRVGHPPVPCNQCVSLASAKKADLFRRTGKHIGIEELF